MGPFWAILEPLGAILGLLWGLLGRSLVHFAAVWGRLGAIWVRFGSSWGLSGPLGAKGGPLWAPWGHLGATLGAILGPFWGHLVATSWPSWCLPGDIDHLGDCPRGPKLGPRLLSKARRLGSSDPTNSAVLDVYIYIYIEIYRYIDI